MSIISDFCIWDNRTFFEGESDKDVQNSKKRTMLCLIQSNRQIIPRENCRYLSRYLDIYKKGSEVSGQTVPLSLFV